MTSTSGVYPNVDLNPTRVFDVSPNYLEAMDNARFVRTFGIAALFFSMLALPNITALNIAASVGLGLFAMWHDNENYFRLFCVVSLIACSPRLPFLSPMIFSFAVFWKGREVLKTLIEEDKYEDNWPRTFRRARIGTTISGVGLLISCVMFVKPLFTDLAELFSG